MSADRPLTDAQERALIELSDRWTQAAQRGVLPSFVRPKGATRPTIEALARLGLVETREYPLSVVARITQAGIDMCHSMGD